jgi:hypothetical protein
MRRLLLILLLTLASEQISTFPLPTLLRQLTEAMAGCSRTNIQLSAEGERKMPA